MTQANRPSGPQPSRESDAETRNAERGTGLRWGLFASSESRAPAYIVPVALLLLITTTLLVFNYVRLQQQWPVDTPTIAKMKVQLAAEKDPKAADALIPKIRQADLELRQQYFLLRQRQTWGSYLFLAELALLAVMLKSAFAAPVHPGKPAQAAEPVAEVRSMLALRNLLGLAACGLLAAGVALNFISRPAGNATAAAVKAPAAPPPSSEQLAANWPRFRGHEGSGIAAFADVPDDWDAKTLKNILWKTPIDLEGASSPIVWGKKVFLAGASKDKRELYCLDADSGKILWQQEVPTRLSQPIDVMEDTGYAAPTPATDGRYVAAIFATGDLGCFDLEGHLIWLQHLGPLDSTYGYASSLSLYKDLVIVLLDQGMAEDKKSRVAAFDLATGRLAWGTKRPVGGSWASPIVVTVAQPPSAVSAGETPARRMGETPMPPAGTTPAAQYITAATPFVISYDPATGQELWRADLLSPDVAPSPIFAGGMVYVVNASAKLAAIRPDGHGDVTATHVAWSAEDGLPDIVSPLSDGKFVLLTTSGGRLTCYRCADGKIAWEKQLDDLAFRPSPVLVGDRVYMLSKDGTMLIARWGEKFEEIRRCNLFESCKASPAFAPGRIFIRTEKNLYAIGAK